MIFLVVTNYPKWWVIKFQTKLSQTKNITSAITVCCSIVIRGQGRWDILILIQMTDSEQVITFIPQCVTYINVTFHIIYTFKHVFGILWPILCWGSVKPIGTEISFFKVPILSKETSDIGKRLEFSGLTHFDSKFWGCGHSDYQPNKNILNYHICMALQSGLLKGYLLQSVILSCKSGRHMMLIPK